MVGIMTRTRKDVLVAAGERGPLPDPRTGQQEWGDYLTVRPLFPDQKLFAATGYTMKGNGDGSNRDATPRFVAFGRAGDGNIIAPPPPSPAPPTPPPPPPVPLGPLLPTPPADRRPTIALNPL